MAFGLYRGIADTAARASEADLYRFPRKVQLVDLDRAAGLWASRIAAFGEEVRLARARAAALGFAISGSGAVACADPYFSAASTHLRQIICLSDAGRRDRLLSDLRARGVDCAPAGERPPWRYLAQVESWRFPNTSHFLATAIRLPFMGRLSESEFAQIREALELTLA